MRTWHLVLAAAGVHLAAVVPALADCRSLDQAVKAAIAAGDTAKLPALAARISGEASCDGGYVQEARRSIALAMLDAGQKPDGSFAPGAVADAAAIARPWQVSMALGDLKYDGRDYKAAAEAYEAAINEIRNVRLVPVPPPREVEEYLAKRAYQAKSLAPTYVASRGFRGEAAGVMVPTFRNFTAVAVPVPIRFATDEADLTEDGEKAVDDLYNYLKGQKPKAVVLIGHTDERGTDAYNNRLSLARAETVAAVLRRKGIDYAIETEGLGKSEPFAADDRTRYSQDDLYSFDRRVEFKVVP